MESKVVKIIGEHVISIIKQYRDVEALCEKEELITPERLAAIAKERYTDRHALYTKDRFMINGLDYWSDILYAKMEMIALVGGLEGLAQVHDWLQNHPENAEYHFASRFDSMAHGLAGWIA